MGKKLSKPTTKGIPEKRPLFDRWGFFSGIKALLSAFPLATTGQKAAIVAMCFGVVMFIGLGLVGSVALPAWAVVTAFSLAIVLIFLTAGLLVVVERSAAGPFPCRHVPIFPPTAEVTSKLQAGLAEIREDVSRLIRQKAPGIADQNIRANIFLLAHVEGGSDDNEWKLVIPENLAVNMDDPRERDLQLSIGQGATGVCFRDGTFQLTRRQKEPKGQWDRKFQMTPGVEALVNANLKWIISFPLLKPGTKVALGVLNIDGLQDVADDETLTGIWSGVREKVSEIAKNLSYQPSTCVRIDQLGVMNRV